MEFSCPCGVNWTSYVHVSSYYTIKELLKITLALYLFNEFFIYFFVIIFLENKKVKMRDAAILFQKCARMQKFETKVLNSEKNNFCLPNWVNIRQNLLQLLNFVHSTRKKAIWKLFCSCFGNMHQIYFDILVCWKNWRFICGSTRMFIEFFSKF